MPLLILADVRRAVNCGHINSPSLLFKGGGIILTTINKGGDMNEEVAMPPQHSQSKFGMFVFGIVIGAAIGAGGYWLYQHNHKSTTTTSTAVTTTATTTTPAASTTTPATTAETSLTPLTLSDDPITYTSKDAPTKSLISVSAVVNGANDSDVKDFSYVTNKFNSNDVALRYSFSTYDVTILPNRPGYANMDAFTKDFNADFAGGDFYPQALTAKYLMFDSSCGSGMASAEATACQTAHDAVYPTIKLK